MSIVALRAPGVGSTNPGAPSSFHNRTHTEDLELEGMEGTRSIWAEVEVAAEPLGAILRRYAWYERCLMLLSAWYLGS